MTRTPALRALRLEVRRRWPLLLFFLAGLAAFAVATPMVEGEAVILLVTPAVLVGFAGFATSWGTVAADRIQGRFEPLRGLPVPLAALAQGRLMLVVLWAATVPLGLVPTWIALDRSEALPVSAGVVALWLIALWLVAATLATWLTALTARWPVERWFGGLFAAGYFIALVAWPWLTPVVTPWGHAIAAWLLSRGATWVAGGAALGMAAALLAASWWPAVRVLGWGIQVAPVGPPERQAALARRGESGFRRYPAGRGGPVAATLALHLRLAMERLPSTTPPAAMTTATPR